MLQAHVPLAFVSVPIWPVVYSVAMSFRGCPFSNVGIISDSLPDPIALLDSLIPLTIVDLSILPSIHALAVRFTIFELTEVGVAVGVPLKAFAVSEIVLPEAFILPSIPVLHHSFSMPFSIDNCPQVYRVLVPYLLKTIHLLDGGKIHFIGFKLDVLWQKTIFVHGIVRTCFGSLLIYANVFA